MLVCCSATRASVACVGTATASTVPSSSPTSPTSSGHGWAAETAACRARRRGRSCWSACVAARTCWWAWATTRPPSSPSGRCVGMRGTASQAASSRRRRSRGTRGLRQKSGVCVPGGTWRWLTLAGPPVCLSACTHAGVRGGAGGAAHQDPRCTISSRNPPTFFHDMPLHSGSSLTSPIHHPLAPAPPSPMLLLLAHPPSPCPTRPPTTFHTAPLRLFPHPCLAPPPRPAPQRFLLDSGVH